MGATKTLFLAMQEQEYLSIPEKIREVYLSSKIYSESPNDFEELMQDETYNRLHKESKKIKKDLEERTYQLREQKRNNKN